MIAVDTSTFVAVLDGSQGRDVALAIDLLRGRQLIFPPAVLSELLSAPNIPAATELAILEVPILAIAEGFWERAGRLRSKMAMAGWNVLLADTLIAQSCLDHDVPLVTRDKGFRAFERHAGLKLR